MSGHTISRAPLPPTLTYSDTIDGVLDCRRAPHPISALVRGSTPLQPLRTCASRTTSSSAITLGPPARFCRILISRLIFFFLTGLSTLTMHLEDEGRWIDSKTCRQEGNVGGRATREQRRTTHLGVLAPPDLAHDLVLVLHAPLHNQIIYGHRRIRSRAVSLLPFALAHRSQRRRAPASHAP